MSVYEWLSLGFGIFVQLVVVISIFASLRERVKRLEVDNLNLWAKQDEAREKHEMIVKIDAKLDMLLLQLSQK